MSWRKKLYLIQKSTQILENFWKILLSKLKKSQNNNTYSQNFETKLL